MSTPPEQAERRIRSLLAAVGDVAPPGHPPAHPRAYAPGSPEHIRLFDHYVQALRASKAAAEEWWGGIVAREAERVGDRAEALRNLRIRRPVGPASYPPFIGTIRACWLHTVELNEGVGETEQVAPEQLSLGWLVESGHSDLADFIALLPFWPLGLNAEGNWS